MQLNYCISSYPLVTTYILVPMSFCPIPSICNLSHFQDYSQHILSFFNFSRLLVDPFLTPTLARGRIVKLSSTYAIITPTSSMPTLCTYGTMIFKWEENIKLSTIMNDHKTLTKGLEHNPS